MRIVVLGTAMIYLALSLASALTRRPFCDEGWFANPAYNLVTKGMMGTTVLEPLGNYRHPTGIQEHTFWIMPLHILAQAAWYRLFGFSLLSLRALSILFGLVGLVAWFEIVRSLTGDRLMAGVAFGFLALDYTWIATASIGRMDMMSAALGFSGLAMYLRLRERHLGFAILGAHALVAAAAFTHPVGGVVSLAALLVLSLRLDGKSFRPAHLAAALAPYFAGMAGWALYIAENPADFRAQFFSNASGRFADLGAPWSILWHEISLRYLESFGFASTSPELARVKVIIPVVYALGFISALGMSDFRRKRGIGTLLQVIGTCVVVLAVFDSTRQEYYLVYGMAPMCVGFSICIYRLWTRRAVPRAAVGVAVAALLLLEASLLGYRIYDLDTMDNRFLPAAAFLEHTIAPRSLLMGSAELGFVLGFDRNLVDDPSLGYYTGKRADYIVVEDLNYEQYFAEYRKKEPALYTYVTRLLTEEYTQVFDNPPYRIYARRHDVTQ